MHRLTILVAVGSAAVVVCTASCAKPRAAKPVGTQGTLAELHNVRPDVQEMKVEQGLEQAMQQYRRFLEEAPETAMTPEAIRHTHGRRQGAGNGRSRARSDTRERTVCAYSGPCGRQRRPEGI